MPIEVSVLDPASAPGLIQPEPIEGDLADVADGAIAVRRSLAADRGWSVGTSLDVRFSDGLDERLMVGAIYGDDVEAQRAKQPGMPPVAAGDIENAAVRNQLRPACDPAGRSQVLVLQSPLPLPLPALLLAPLPGCL